jgi:hypothetical protein
MIIMGKEVHKIWIIESQSGGKPYETIQYCNGSTSCNCFSWIKRKPVGGERTCKHVRMVEMGQADIYAVSSKEYGSLLVKSSVVKRTVPIPVSRPTIVVSGAPVVSRKFNFDAA